MTKKEATEKLMRYCAYQDRCHQEVRQKLLDLEVYGDDLEEVVIELIQHGFLDEERYARSFARGKFRVKKWGRNKITLQLKQKDISDYCIRAGLEEIDSKEYHEALEEILIRKFQQITAPNIYIHRHKVATFAITKGYEPELVWEMLRNKKFSPSA